MGDWPGTRPASTKSLDGPFPGALPWNEWSSASRSRHHSAQVAPSDAAQMHQNQLFSRRPDQEAVQLSPPPPLNVTSQVLSDMPTQQPMSPARMLMQHNSFPPALHRSHQRTRTPSDPFPNNNQPPPLHQFPSHAQQPQFPPQQPASPYSFPPPHPNSPPAGLNPPASQPALQQQALPPAVQQQVSRHQRMLLFLRHCAKCQDPTSCPFGWKCESGKALWHHIFQCGNPKCAYPNCVSARELLRHYRQCIDTACPICPAVREFLASPRTRDAGMPASF